MDRLRDSRYHHPQIAAVLPVLAALGLIAVTLATLAAYAPRHRYTPSA
jgi:hypothetical protein